jgi:hypothetical protein
MSLPAGLLNSTVCIKRRSSQGRDSLNNPTYGAPTLGNGWATIYEGIPARLAFNLKQVRFAMEGERVQPTGILYYNPGPDIKAEDRVLTDDGIEYNVISVVKGYTLGTVVDHYEAVVQLP